MNRNSIGVKILVGLACSGVFVLTQLGGQQTRNHHGNFQISQDQPAVEKTFPISGSAPIQLDLDNLSGPIHVVGDSNGNIRMTARETIWGDDNDDIEHAKKEVHLDTSQHDNSVKLYVDGPFRCGQDGAPSCEHWGNYGYTVDYDFELHVPASTAATLKTVNDGDIKMENLAGDFDVRNVNGGLDLEEVSGSGTARTVNGSITARFKSNPRNGLNLNTVNGSVHLYMQPGLSADVSYRTLNGSIYTDFDTTALPAGPPEQSSDGRAHVYRVDRSGRVRIGQGGPEIHLQEVNGNIFIHKSK